jgi:F-box domain
MEPLMKRARLDEQGTAGRTSEEKEEEGEAQLEGRETQQQGQKVADRRRGKLTKAVSQEVFDPHLKIPGAGDLSSLPQNLVSHVLSFLTLYDVMVFSSSSRDLRRHITQR